MPFWYKGESIYLTLWMCNWYDVRMKYRYMAYDNADARMASLMRSGNYCFNNDTYETIAEYFGTQLMYELPDHRLPAFRTPYYTNDIRITTNNYGGSDVVVELFDENGNLVKPAEDGNYYSLDHTMVYQLAVNNKAFEEIRFDNIYTDVDITVTKDNTAVEELDVNKAVANVTYYNLAGQQSAQPLDGVNIVVTTYTDGSTTTAKVIK